MKTSAQIKIYQRQPKGIEKRVDFAALEKIYAFDATQADAKVRAALRDARDELIKQIEMAGKDNRISPLFVATLKVNTNPVAKILQEYLVFVWRKARDLATQEMPGKVKDKLEPLKIYSDEKIDFVFCPTGKGGGIDPTCSPEGVVIGQKSLLATSTKFPTKGNYLFHGTSLSALSSIGKKGLMPAKDMWGESNIHFIAGDPYLAITATDLSSGILLRVKTDTIKTKPWGDNPDHKISKTTISVEDIEVLTKNGWWSLNDIPTIKKKSDEESEIHSYATGFSPQLALDYFASRAVVLKGIIDDALLNQAKLRLMEYIKGGQTLNEMIGNLRAVFEPWVGDPTKIGPSGQVGIGFPPGTSAPENILMAYRLENIIRTETTTAMSQGRLAVGDAAGDYVIGYQLSAILDERTTLTCQTADGVMFRKEDPAAVKLLPPLHFMCRTVPIFVTTDELPVEWSTPAEIDAAVRLIPQGFK